MFSLPFALMALPACKKSQAGPLKLLQLVLLLTCILPSFITTFTLFPNVLQFLTTGSTTGQTLVAGYPFPTIWGCFLLFCLCANVVMILVSRTLVEAWAPRHGKRQ